jgi:hypothetical protein
MNHGSEPMVRFHMTIVFEWKMMAVICSSVLIRSLMK